LLGWAIPIAGYVLPKPPGRPSGLVVVINLPEALTREVLQILMDVFAANWSQYRHKKYPTDSEVFLIQYCLMAAANHSGQPDKLI